MGGHKMENKYDFFDYLENNSRPTQCSRIIDYLNEFGSITQLEALRDLGVMRLASRISELNKTYDIKSETEYGTNRYGEKVKWSRYSFNQENK
jgi:hypothetical protein